MVRERRKYEGHISNNAVNNAQTGYGLGFAGLFATWPTLCLEHQKRELITAKQPGLYN